jgi:hypothetical protein
MVFVPEMLSGNTTQTNSSRTIRIEREQGQIANSKPKSVFDRLGNGGSHSVFERLSGTDRQQQQQQQQHNQSKEYIPVYKIQNVHFEVEERELLRRLPSGSNLKVLMEYDISGRSTGTVHFIGGDRFEVEELFSVYGTVVDCSGAEASQVLRRYRREQQSESSW